MKQDIAPKMMSPKDVISRVQINFSELYCEKLCKKNILERPQRLGLRDRIF